MEDLAAIYVGPAAFRFLRLMFGVVVTVHVFACAFWRVKVRSRSVSHPDRVGSPLGVSEWVGCVSRGCGETVRCEDEWGGG